MVSVVTGFIAIFKDLGLSAATIQKAEITNEQISTLFWLNVTVSAGVMVLTALLAPAVAWFYGEPKLTEITMAYAVGFLLGGIAIQHEALLRRRMRFIAFAVAELVSSVVGIVVAVTLAWHGMRYWAISVKPTCIWIVIRISGLDFMSMASGLSGAELGSPLDASVWR